MKYKIVPKCATKISKIKRSCGNCSRQYEVMVFLSDESPGVLECNQCSLSLLYHGNLRSLEEELGGQEISLEQIKKNIESKVTTCPRCNGQFRHVLGRSYGVPTHCPFCKMSQESLNSRLKFSDDEIYYVSEEVYWLEIAKDGGRLEMSE